MVTNKIRRYVNYQFRFVEHPEVLAKKEEIVSKITEHYEELLRQGKSPEEAYVEAIKSKGDFAPDLRNQVPFEYSQRPTTMDIFLVIAFVLGIVSAVAAVFNFGYQIPLLATSLAFYWGASYFLYAESQYVRKIEYDIAKHHLLLRKKFKFLIPNLVTWGISISYVFARDFASRLAQRVYSKSDYTIHLKDYYDRYLIGFLVMNVIIVFVVFLLVYLRMNKRYKELTDESQPSHVSHPTISN